MWPGRQNHPSKGIIWPARPTSNTQTRALLGQKPNMLWGGEWGPGGPGVPVPRAGGHAAPGGCGLLWGGPAAAGPVSCEASLFRADCVLVASSYTVASPRGRGPNPLFKGPALRCHRYFLTCLGQEWGEGKGTGGCFQEGAGGPGTARQREAQNLDGKLRKLYFNRRL